MSAKYYNALKVMAYNLQGTMERLVRLCGFIGKPVGRVIRPMTNTIEIYQGDSRIIRVSVRDSDLNVVDLNGGYAKLYIAETSKSDEYLLVKSTTNISEGAITNPTYGEVSFFLGSTDTASLPESQYFYLVQVYLATGAKYVVVTGYMNVFKDIGVQPLPPPDPHTGIESVDLTAGISSYAIDILSGTLIIGPSLIAPSGASENIYVTNVVYTSLTATVYFSTTIHEAGWKLSYMRVIGS
jgi:hypothetical protein